MKKFIVLFILLAGCLAIACWWFLNYTGSNKEKLLTEYFSYVEDENFEAMYDILSQSSKEEYPKEAFVERNSAIYEGIEISNIQIEIIDENKDNVDYHIILDTVAGLVEYDNSAVFIKENHEYKLVWSDAMIYPSLSKSDKIRVKTTSAKRGQIYDRNGSLLAGDGTAVSVGLVPGSMEEETVKLLSEKIGMSEERIQKKLAASWVKEDSFVPVQNRKYISELHFLSMEADEEDIEEYSFQKELVKIPGVVINEIQVRSYPMGAAAAHLTGYVQSVTAEDLEKHPNEGYTQSSVIGRSGMEALYEDQLRGKNGVKIFIVDKEGNEKEVIADVPVENGEDVKLTIDSGLQSLLYNEFQDDPGCSVAMNPYTGEVLALVSTPSYDNNKYILGMDTETWENLNSDEKKPLYNRFRAVWCPGSTMKPITGSIALDENVISPDEDFGSEGLSWQKDESWGAYKITTLHEYHPVTLRNALIYSDNIYFAKTALRIGSDAYEEELKELGFREQLPFEIVMQQSTYSNEEHISGEIQLADSGYGQGQMLVNPLHLACIYTAYLNAGNIIRPYLTYEENKNGSVWIPEAFSRETANTIFDGLEQVIANEHGTGHAAYDGQMPLAGKTGTAELKASKDSQGGEIGWFCVMTTEEERHPVLIVSMVEDVSALGGSGYVVRKDKVVLDGYLSSRNEP